MATCAVSGVLKDLSETAISGAVIKARVITPYFSTTIQIMPMEISTTSDASGVWSLNLLKSAGCVVTIEYPPNSMDSRRRVDYAITVPTSATADFSTLATEL